MSALLGATIALIVVSGWIIAGFFLGLPHHLIHSFDWLFAWVHLFNKVGQWIVLGILVSILSWLMGE